MDESSNPIRTITFDYDAASQLKEVSDQDSTYKYTYDNGGRLISVDNAGTPGVPNVVLDYTYDDVNNLLDVTETIDGEASGIESFVYDDLNRVIQTTQTGTGVTDKRVDFEYDNAYRMTEVTRYSDLAGTIEVATSDYDYDIANRLTELTHKKGDHIIAEYDWSYDAVNRLIGLESVDGSSSFSYDELDQLTDAEYSFQEDENYSYDENGNRTNSGYETEADNQLSSDGTYNYEYDGEGNLIKRTEIATGEVMELSWDYRNRLTGVEVKDSNDAVIESVEYVYDAFDRRLGKIVDADGDGSESAVAERFVYDGHHIALVFDEDGDLVNRYLHGPGIDQVLAQEDGLGEVLWGLTDNQGSVRDVVDDSGEVVNHIVYDGFGGVVSETDSTVEFRFGYTGRELDEETGWYYYRARYYDPGVGRFVSEDPIGFAGRDVNLYGYVGNNPLNFTDPSGRIPLSTALSAAAALALADGPLPVGDLAAAGILLGVGIGIGIGYLIERYGNSVEAPPRPGVVDGPPQPEEGTSGAIKPATPPRPFDPSKHGPREERKPQRPQNKPEAPDPNNCETCEEKYPEYKTYNELRTQTEHMPFKGFLSLSKGEVTQKFMAHRDNMAGIQPVDRNWWQVEVRPWNIPDKSIKRATPCKEPAISSHYNLNPVGFWPDSKGVGSVGSCQVCIEDPNARLVESFAILNIKDRDGNKWYEYNGSYTDKMRTDR